MTSQILIVDDDPDAREVLELILGTLQIPILQARNGDEAQQMIRVSKPLLIVLDLQMPHVDGEAVLTWLQSDPGTVDIPVILYTAKTLTDDDLGRLKIPLGMVVRKGKLSMTHLRNLVVEKLGSEISIDPEYL